MFRMKYGIWKVAEYDRAAAKRFQDAGVSALTAAVLCSRGYDTPEKAAAFLRADCTLSDPYSFPDMGKAVARIRQALENRENMNPTYYEYIEGAKFFKVFSDKKIFGIYDVDAKITIQ